MRVMLLQCFHYDFTTIKDEMLETSCFSMFFKIGEFRFPSPALCMHFFILIPIYIQQVFMALPAHLFTLHHPKERKHSYET